MSLQKDLNFSKGIIEGSDSYQKLLPNKKIVSSLKYCWSKVSAAV